MLKIKLVRVGKRNQPQYRLVIQEARAKLKGKTVDLLGFYNPLTDPATVKIDQKKYEQWIKQGAKPTEKVRLLVKKHLSPTTKTSKTRKDKSK